MTTLRDLTALAIALTVLVALCAFTSRQSPSQPITAPNIEAAPACPVAPVATPDHDDAFILNPELAADAA